MSLEFRYRPSALAEARAQKKYKRKYGAAPALVILCSAWITHAVWIISKLASDQGATGGQIALGILGCVAFPIGIIHGFYIWVTSLLSLL